MFNLLERVNISPPASASPPAPASLGLATARPELCPVRPADWGLLGYKLPDPARPDQYEYYFDIVLPFGGRSSPRIFEDLAEVIDWAMRQEGFQPIRFVDDILSTGRSGTGECAAAMAHLAATCADLGVPLSPEKRTGPTTCSH
eukprot:tig00001164_g7412.t1